MSRNLTLAVLAALATAIAGCGGGEKQDHDDHPTAAPAPSESPGPGAGTAVATADTAVAGRARDPVCGMTTDVAGNPESVYRETRFHFCSADCREKFEAAPSKSTTGLPGEGCVCTAGEMANCNCGHCKGEPSRCPCGDPKPEKEGAESHEGHDHDHDGH